MEVTHAYPNGSSKIESSYSRIPRYKKEIQELGVKISSSIDELLLAVDYVLLETNDGHPRLAQAQKVIDANKPLFIDKPVAASYKHVKEIYTLAEQARLPIFSSSGLRYAPSTQKLIQESSIGDILGVSTYCSSKREASHPSMYWYGIHGIEGIFALMGTGCKEVQMLSTSVSDLVIGKWENERIATFRGIRTGKATYGGTAFGEKGVANIGKFEGYEPLVEEIGHFFTTGKSPVAPEETLEIYAFMSACDLSYQRGGKWVELEEILSQ